MMVLSRKQNETIVVSGPAVVTVVAVHGGKVRLGVTADPGVRVDRGEVAARIAEEARIAAACYPPAVPPTPAG